MVKLAPCLSVSKEQIKFSNFIDIVINTIEKHFELHTYMNINDVHECCNRWFLLHMKILSYNICAISV